MGAVGVGDLPDEPRLADARLADDRDHLAVARGRAPERLAELLQLGVAPDEAGQPARGRRVEPRARRPGAGQLVDLDRRLEPLDRHRPSGLTST